MTLDVSLEAIEADLAMAERGGQVAVLALARAQVRATLLAPSIPMFKERHLVTPEETKWSGVEDQPAIQAGPSPDIQIAQGADVDVYTVPKSSSWVDRVTAAARLLGIDIAKLAALLEPEDTLEPTLEAPAEPHLDLDIEEDDVDADFGPVPSTLGPDPLASEEDFFAEARKARRKK